MKDAREHDVPQKTLKLYFTLSESLQNASITEKSSFHFPFVLAVSVEFE